MSVRVALVGGPMYDGLYQSLGLFDRDDVEVIVHADHPTLNRTVARMLADGERIDVLSTHAKYTPSQAEWLLPVEELVPAEVIAALSPTAVELCRAGGSVGTALSLPRLIDVRILWVDPAQMPDAPLTWADVAESGSAFGMPGRESGLFGTFYELVVGAGGHLLSGGVAVDRAVAIEAIETLVRIVEHGPEDQAGWHYDDVDRALLDGRVAAAGAWPGSTGQIRELAPHLRPHPYPAGPLRRVTYSGCHSWAVPRTCGDLSAAGALLAELSSVAAHAADAAGGSVCAHEAAFAAVEPVDAVDARRLDLVRDAIATQMITYPPLVDFPVVEDAGWMAIRDVFTGDETPEGAVDRIEAAIGELENW